MLAMCRVLAAHDPKAEVQSLTAHLALAVAPGIKDHAVTIDLRDRAQSARVVCRALNLLPHREGGHYRELWRDQPASGERGSSTSILFLLAEGEQSRWHRVDATEIWLWQAGAPLLLGVAGANESLLHLRLGPDLASGEQLQGVVAAHAWQEASSLGAWTLVSCVVAPAFEFSGFEMAAAGWSPSPG